MALVRPLLRVGKPDSWYSRRAIIWDAIPLRGPGECYSDVILRLAEASEGA